MVQPIIKNSYLVEVDMPTVTQGQRYYFNDIPTLRAPMIFVEGIEAYTENQLAVSPNSLAVIPSGVGIVVTFAIKETEELYQIPYSTLVAALNAGLIREFAGKQINLTKSYLTILDPSLLSANQAAVFNFYYKKA